MAYYFLPPTVAEGPAGGGPLFFRYKLTRANSVLQRSKKENPFVVESEKD